MNETMWYTGRRIKSLDDWLAEVGPAKWKPGSSAYELAKA